MAGKAQEPEIASASLLIWISEKRIMTELPDDIPWV
jgi:hypothetical protein